MNNSLKTFDVTSNGIFLDEIGHSYFDSIDKIQISARGLAEILNFMDFTNGVYRCKKGDYYTIVTGKGEQLVPLIFLFIGNTLNSYYEDYKIEAIIEAKDESGNSKKVGGKLILETNGDTEITTCFIAEIFVRFPVIITDEPQNIPNFI